MPREKIPEITLQQKLFAERYWNNGGNMIEAVAFAGYAGYPEPGEKAKKGRQLLASKAVKAYMGYLRAKQKREKAAEDQRLADLKSTQGDGQGITGEIVEVADGSGLTASVGSNDGFERDPVGGSNQNPVVFRPEASRGPGYLKPGVDVCDLVPPMVRDDLVVPLEMDPTEIRRLLADIARGNVRTMNDSRTRMRAIELVMKNLGMLVDLQATQVVTTNGPDIASMTPEQRREEAARLEAYLGKATALLAEAPAPLAVPVADSAQ